MPEETSEAIDELRQRLADARRAGNSAGAARLIHEAWACELIPRKPDASRWLRERLGAGLAEWIVDAFATSPCLLGAGGLEECRDCGGKGILEGGTPCGTCDGLGLANCPYCNGSGLAPYDAAPLGLRPAILRRRVEHAAGQLAPLGRAKPGDKTARKDLARRIVAINRVRGMLDNALEAARQGSLGRGGDDAMPEASQRAIAREVATAGAAADKALRETLALLGAAYEREADRRDGDTAARRAEWFTRAAQRKRFGDFLRRPELERLLARRAG